MAGYTRQSASDILNGQPITAPPLNAEFNQIASAFDGSTGHEHTGAVGDAPKIDLTTSVEGYLPQNNGGTGGKNNLSATSNPTVGDDAADGYVPGSLWENTTTGRVFVCVGNTTGAAVWREIALYSSNAITPATHDTVDLGTTSTRFQDLFLSGGVATGGNSTFGGTVTVTGTTNLNGDVNLGDGVLDNITFLGFVDSNIIPDSGSTFDLGSTSKKWNNIHALEYHGSTLAIAGASTLRDTSPETTATYNLGSNTVRWGTVFTGAVNTDGSSTMANILPVSDSTHDLGSWTVRWANVYADTLTGDLEGNLTRSYTYTKGVAPNLDSTYNLGTSSARWVNVYADNTDSNAGTILTLSSNNITTSNVTASNAVNVSNQLKFTEGASDWTFEVDASNNLIIKYGTTTVLELTTAGALSVKDDITAFDNTL